MNIVAIVGTFGSGCSYIAKRYFADSNYKYISLSKFVKDEYSKSNPDSLNPSRSILQDYGNSIREDKGSDFFAKLAMEEIDTDGNHNYVIDSIRNYKEIEALRNKYPSFFLLGINADIETRWGRVNHQKYKGNRSAFDKDEERDREESFSYGQQVAKCFERADYVIINEKNILERNREDTLMRERVKRFLQLVNRDATLTPNESETAMAIAHAASHRSSCLKRKVGAVIVDNFSSVFASGYNEVPPSSRSCMNECGTCYRSFLRKGFRKDIESIVSNAAEVDAVDEKFRSSIKMMDYCRALHAEENAILSVVRNGVSGAISGATLYTTTFPCNLCANKIAEIGIKNVIYASPYPMKEAKETLIQNDVKCESFEGITYIGYFKMEGNFL